MEQYSDVQEEEPNELLFLNCVNFVLFLGQAFVAVAIGQFGLFGFPSTQEISDLYPTLITAASWVAIAVTFILIVAQLIWATAQLFPKFRLRSNDGVKHYYVGVALCQVVWVMMVSCELLFMSLFGALAVLAFLGFILYDQGKLVSLESKMDYGILKFPFVLYFGWMIYVILWTLSIVLVYARVAENVQYWVALLSLVAMGMTAFGTIFFSRTEYSIPLLIAYVTVSENESR